YAYDSLNRLSSVTEVPYTTGVPGPNWQQAYTYDRWGNRTINTGATWGTGINNTAFNVNADANQLTPAGAGVMTYDNAGNLITNTYAPAPGSSAANFSYDAENRLTEARDGTNQTVLSRYAYDAGGHRVRRSINGVETWQVYGLDGELIAEYPANGAATAPQKEYGYRGGELLITAERKNVAAAANGATATAQNFTQDGVYPGSHFYPSSTNDGQRYGHLLPDGSDINGFW